ncbi:MAG TPA: hypothetical protein V6C71_16180 [Coleofasciculaceae cyanobacterium]
MNYVCLAIAKKTASLTICYRMTSFVRRKASPCMICEAYHARTYPLGDSFLATNQQ